MTTLTAKIQSLPREPQPLDRFDHPDFIGGIIWTNCELRFIEAREAALRARNDLLVEALDITTAWLNEAREAFIAADVIDRSALSDLDTRIDTARTVLAACRVKP